MSASPPSMPLPQAWPESVKSAFICAVALARAAVVETRSWCVNSRIARVRLAADNERLTAEVAMLREELRIKDARLGAIPALRRPHYPPAERLAILALKAARGWNNAQTARAMLVTAATIASWLKRLAEAGPDALVQLPQPVNRFPEYVAMLVQQLKSVCPVMGKVRIAQLLARAGLHLAPSTVRRMLDKQSGTSPSRPAAAATKDHPENSDCRREKPIATEPHRTVTATHPNHIWHIDLTAVPTHCGFWLPWFPFASLQCWPYCFWVAAVVDHFSRKAVMHGVFKAPPSARQVTDWLDVAIQVAGRAPKYIISDQGVQFREDYRDWCQARGIKPRFGAIGQHGSIAVIERFFLSLKNECTRRIVVPLRLDAFQAELSAYFNWYNEVRPHQSLRGWTPNEVYADLAVRDGPRFETRARLKMSSTNDSAIPLEPDRVTRLELEVTHFEGRSHLPIVAFKRAA